MLKLTFDEPLFKGYLLEKKLTSNNIRLSLIIISCTIISLIALIIGCNVFFFSSCLALGAIFFSIALFITSIVFLLLLKQHCSISTNKKLQEDLNQTSKLVQVYRNELECLKKHNDYLKSENEDLYQRLIFTDRVILNDFVSKLRGFEYPFRKITARLSKRNILPSIEEDSSLEEFEELEASLGIK